MPAVRLYPFLSLFKDLLFTTYIKNDVCDMKEGPSSDRPIENNLLGSTKPLLARCFCRSLTLLLKAMS